MTSNEPGLDSSWGAAPAGMKEPGHFVLEKLLNDPATPMEVLNRVTLVSGMYDVRGYDHVFNRCVQSGALWPKLLASALYDNHVPAFDRFHDMKDVVLNLDPNIGPVAKPLMADMLPSHIPALPANDYSLKEEHKNKYLEELLGKKNVDEMEKRAQEQRASDKAGPARPAAIPLSKNTTRMLGRRQAPSAFPDNAPLVPLQRRHSAPQTNARVRSAETARLRMRQLQGSANRKKMQTITDLDALPPAPDSLRARQLKRDEDRKKKEELEARRKERKEAQLRLQAEKRKQRSAHKRQVAKEHREEVQRYNDEMDFSEEDDVATIAQSPVRLSRNEAALYSNDDDDEGDYDDDDEMMTPRRSKKRRLDEDDDEVPVPRRSTDAPASAPRSGAEAHAARARLSRGTGYMSSSSPRSAPRERPTPPQSRAAAAQFRRNTVIAPSAMREETERRHQSAARMGAISHVEETDEFRSAVGGYCGSLSVEDRRFLVSFFDLSCEPASFFRRDEMHRDVVLDEDQEQSLLLRITPDGNWKRVRITTGSVQNNARSVHA